MWRCCLRSCWIFEQKGKQTCRLMKFPLVFHSKVAMTAVQRAEEICGIKSPRKIGWISPKEWNLDWATPGDKSQEMPLGDPQKKKKASPASSVRCSDQVTNIVWQNLLSLTECFSLAGLNCVFWRFLVFSARNVTRSLSSLFVINLFVSFVFLMCFSLKGNQRS